MNQTRVKKPVSPTELWFCGALLGLVALCFTLFGWLEEVPRIEKLRRFGVTVNALVQNKVNFTKLCEPNRKGIARTCQITELYVRFLVPSAPNSSLRYGSVSVSKAVYETSQIGQTVPIIYLLEGSTDLWLAADVQNFTMLWYNLLGVFGAFAVVFCTIQTVLALRRAQKGKIYA